MTHQGILGRVHDRVGGDMGGVADVGAGLHLLPNGAFVRSIPAVIVYFPSLLTLLVDGFVVLGGVLHLMD